MESYILNAIANIREGKKRPSKEEIFRWIQRRESVADEVFNDEFDTLLSKGIIYNKNGKNSYYIFNIFNTSDNTSDDVDICNSNSGDDNQQEDDRDLINMVKNIMLNEKQNDQRNIDSLRLELRHKNEIIDKLLTNLIDKEKTCNKLIETMLVKSTNTPHICDVCNTKEKSSSRSISNKTIINDHVSINNDIPSRSNLSKCNYVNHSQVDRNNEKVYSWISSNERSSVYENISEFSDTNEDYCNVPSPINYQNNAIRSQYNHCLQSIDIEAIENRYHDSPRNSRNSSTNNNNNNHVWPENTCLIVGSSIINNLDENKFNKGNLVVKVRPFSGSTIQDMYSYITPLLRKQPKYIILHVGGNDAPYKSADDILVELLQLKAFVIEKLPGCTIYLSQPTTRFDNTKAKYTIQDLNTKLNLLNINIIDNSNIDVEQLGKKGLHLNKWGTSRLAMNYLSLMRQF